MPSIFSRIVSGELPAYKVAEDADHLAFLDITPLVEGHTLVIPKKEVDYIFDLPAGELAALHQFAQRVAQGTAVIGLEVPHAHIHLIPMQKVADMNFANPKIKVGEERMKELAAAIAAKVEGSPGQGHEKADSAGPDKDKDKNKGKDQADETLQQLQELTSGLFFVSESEAPLEAVSYEAKDDLSDAALLRLLGEPAGTAVQTVELTQFLRHHTADDGVLGDADLANRYKALQLFLKQELDDTQVYRIGGEPQIRAYALGRTLQGKLAGFKTVLTET